MQNGLRLRQCLINVCSAAIVTSLLLVPSAAAARPATQPQIPKAVPAAADTLNERRALFEQIGIMTGLPWQHLAAIDQYERTITKARPSTRQKQPGMLAIQIPQEDWSGPLNPEREEISPGTISWFHGIGMDGDGDGRADRLSDADKLYSVAALLVKSGSSADDFAIGLWHYYQNPRAVQRVMQFSKIYETLGRMNLSEHAFPVPVRSSYSYRSTWGTSRSWGGYRIHEGTDIFAGYGVPVRSTCYGIVEIKGWNAYGGWRVGIRDLDNLYHYYAHLSGYDKKLMAGDVVKPGQVIGWVGSSGYGKPGTQGKFPPHLHYGLYRDRGLFEWSFDPYPLLRRWESEEWKRIKAKK